MGCFTSAINNNSFVFICFCLGVISGAEALQEMQQQLTAHFGDEIGSEPVQFAPDVPLTFELFYTWWTARLAKL